MLGLDQTATVYTPAVSDGTYTVVAKTGLACRLVLATIATASGAERAAQTGARLLLWGPGYSMPESAQVAVGGVRWNVQPGTLAAERGPSGAVILQRAEVTEAR